MQPLTADFVCMPARDNREPVSELSAPDQFVNVGLKEEWVSKTKRRSESDPRICREI
jgi:hypothetical protein